MTITKKYLQEWEESARTYIPDETKRSSLIVSVMNRGRMNGLSRIFMFKSETTCPAAIGKSPQCNMKPANRSQPKYRFNLAGQ